MIDKDGISEQRIIAAIDWSQSNWWRTRIASMPKLREKFDVLREQATEEQEKKKARLNGNPKLAIIRDYIATEGME
jgi:hypothetical protein